MLILYFCYLKEEHFSAGVFVEEGDVAQFTICTIEDLRTLNKTLYLRPPGNVCSMNDLADLWETKINKSLKRIYIAEDELLNEIHGKLTAHG